MSEDVSCSYSYWCSRKWANFATMLSTVFWKQWQGFLSFQCLRRVSSSGAQNQPQGPGTRIKPRPRELSAVPRPSEMRSSRDRWSCSNVGGTRAMDSLGLRNRQLRLPPDKLYLCKNIQIFRFELWNMFQLLVTFYYVNIVSCIAFSKRNHATFGNWNYDVI